MPANCSCGACNQFTLDTLPSNDAQSEGIYNSTGKTASISCMSWKGMELVDCQTNIYPECVATY